MSTLQQQSRQLFDNVYQQFNEYQVATGMAQLVAGLAAFRAATPADEWREFAQSGWLGHPLKALAHQDPMTRRAFEKPRGYAGDAELLDLIYGLRPLPAETSSLGAIIYGFTAQAPAAAAVRVRRNMLARKIDEAAARVAQPRILSVACGHLREAQKSAAVAAGRVGEFFALDQDQFSLATIAREQTAVTPVHGSVKSILKGETAFSDLDLVYSTGLYDYLPQPVAQKLTARLFEMLRPGGRLILANLLPGFASLGYMETFMGWPMIYRDDAEMADVAAGISPEQIASRQLFRDTHEHVVFLEVEKQ